MGRRKVQGREANRRRHRLTEPTTKALCQPPPPKAVMLCCMPTTGRRADMQKGLTPRVRFASAFFTPPFASSLFPILSAVMRLWGRCNPVAVLHRVSPPPVSLTSFFASLPSIRPYPPPPPGPWTLTAAPGANVQPVSWSRLPSLYRGGDRNPHPPLYPAPSAPRTLAPWGAVLHHFF